MASAAHSNQKNDLPSSISVKLDRENFPLWKSLVLPIIRGCKLDGYILGTKECPDQFITSTETSGKKINPDFEDWQAEDQRILGWLLNSMTVGTATQLLHCETSKQLWDEAQSLAGAHTRSRVIYLRSEFHNTRKGEKKMEDYLMKMKDLADKLKMAGSPITNADLIIQTLNGLDTDYNPIVVKLSDQINLSWVDLQAQLLSFESRLDQLNSFNNLNLNATANVANKAQFRNRYNPRGSWRGSRFRNMRGKGKGRPSNDICQVCNKHGHTAIECDHRYDKSYTGSNYSNTNVEKQGTHSAFLASPYNTQDYEWYFDSGASNHVTHQADKFQELTENNGKNSLIVGNGAKLEIVASGSSKLKNLNLHDVLYVPQITKNLLSVSKLTSDNNIIAEFDNNCCFVKDKLTGKVLLRGILKDGLYQLSNGSSQTNKDSCVYLSVKENWHRKLGHPSNNVLDKVLKICNVKTSPSDKFKFCEACQLGKSHLLPFKSSSSHAQEVLELIHTDVWGPSPINSISGFKYYVHFIDDSSRFTWIYPLKQKSDTIHAFMQFKNMVEKQFNKRIKIIQCDGGGEFKPVQKVALETGIQFRMSCPYTSQQNGRAERKHRHVAELGLTLLAQAKMPLHYWWEAFSTAVYLINRLPSSVTQNESPYFLIHKKEPDYNVLKPFGCACYPCLKPYNKHKLQFHTTRCVFLGYSSAHKGYKCINSHGRVFISRHVVFNEDHFPFHDGFLDTRNPLKTLTESTTALFPLFPAGNAVINTTNEPIGHEENSASETNPSTDQLTSSDSFNGDGDDSQPMAIEDSTQRLDNITRDNSDDHNGDSTETSQKSTQIEPETGVTSEENNTNTHWMRTRSKAGVYKPKQPYIGMIQGHTDDKEPESASEALARPEWKKAMDLEFQALMSNQTWTLVPYQGQSNIIDSKWVFKTKFKADGSIERRKARLVARGFQQTAGVDFEETFSPVVRASTVRIILTIAVHLNWDIRQLDINNAFLNGHLKETVYMSQPEGYADPTKPDHLCKLSKALYGLKQAPRAWFDSLKNALLNWGFHNTKSDSSLFILKGTEHTTFLLIYVDDIIVTGSNSKFLDAFIKQLNVVFSLKDLGQLHYFLGIEVQRDAGGLYLKQSRYINDLLKKFKMEKC
jgi:histone deacetylase 1/2